MINTTHRAGWTGEEQEPREHVQWAGLKMKYVASARVVNEELL